MPATPYVRASVVALFVTLCLGNASGEAASSSSQAGSQTQTRDLRPGEPRPASRQELELARTLASGSPTAAPYLALAKLQEARGAMVEAESTLQQARAALPADKIVVLTLASLYNRTAQFEKAMSTFEDAASMSPSDPSIPLMIASAYQERVQKDSALPVATRLEYIQSGIAATERALAVAPDAPGALILKLNLIRYQANMETNEAARTLLKGEADQISQRLTELQPSRTVVATDGSGSVGRSGMGVMAPSGAPPQPQPAQLVDGLAPVRVGGNIRTPTKLVDARPVYPPEAQAARVTGVVIIEATIDTAGLVREARVLRSIPMLDQASIDAVRQWQFTPTTLNGQPVPVIMTVTVNFTMQE